MEQNILLIVDCERICRLCLQSTGAMSNIFVDNDGRVLKDMIYCAIGIEISETDNLPTNICHKCRHIIELGCDLRLMAIKSQALLKQTTSDLVAEAEEHIIEKETKVTTFEVQEEILDDCINKAEAPNSPSIESETKELTPRYNTGENKVLKATAKHLTCQICLNAFTTQEQTHRHCEKHYETSKLTAYFKLKKPYKCEMCNMLVNKKQLVTHHRMHLNINPFVCPEPNCNYIGKNKDCLRHHSLVHFPGRHICAVCGATFSRRGSLRQHDARAHGSAPRKCGVCGVLCKNKLTFAAHTASHEKPPQHACAVPGCNKLYYSRYAAAAHAQTHLDLRQYKCNLCVATYNTQSLLNRHIREHASKRARRCVRCGRVFTDYTQFYLHRVNEHGHWVPHKCSCGARFEKESHLEKHQLNCQVALCMQVNPGQSGSCAEPEELVTEICINKLQHDTTANKQDASSEIPSNGLLYIEVESEDVL